MIKEIPLHTRVYVPEVKTEGLIYESQYNWPCRVYGIRFSKTVWPSTNFATVVLHLRPCQFIIQVEKK